jgi:hypothetical protein
MDFLAQKTINALEQFTDMPDSWIKDKCHDFKEKDRLSVLRSFSNFDAENLEVICEALGVSVDDMQATLRVLRKI